MAELSELAALALRGTSRTTLAAPPPGPLGEALKAAERPEPETTLLARAALLEWHRKAGRAPQAAESPPLEMRPAPVNPAPTALVELLYKIAAHSQELLRQTLEQVAAQGWTLSARTALTLGTVNEQNLLALWPLLDERARAVLAGHPLQRRWESAEASHLWQERVVGLRELRHRDSLAGAAETLTLWQTVKADGRRDLLDLMTGTLTEHDRATLELGFKDRSPEIQKRSRQLLAHLPGPLRQEVEALLPQAVKVVRNWAGQFKKLTFPAVTLPEALGKPAKNVYGDTELGRLIGALPLSRTLELLQITETQLREGLRQTHGLVEHELDLVRYAERSERAAPDPWDRLRRFLSGDTSAIQSLPPLPRPSPEQEHLLEESLNRLLTLRQREGASWFYEDAALQLALAWPLSRTPQPPAPLPFVFRQQKGHDKAAQQEEIQRDQHTQRHEAAQQLYRHVLHLLKLRRRLNAVFESAPSKSRPSSDQNKGDPL